MEKLLMSRNNNYNNHVSILYFHLSKLLRVDDHTLFNRILTYKSFTVFADFLDNNSNNEFESININFINRYEDKWQRFIHFVNENPNILSNTVCLLIMHEQTSASSLGFKTKFSDDVITKLLKAKLTT